MDVKQETSEDVYDVVLQRLRDKAKPEHHEAPNVSYFGSRVVRVGTILLARPG